jgi:hypothetical protein
VGQLGGGKVEIGGRGGGIYVDVLDVVAYKKLETGRQGHAIRTYVRFSWSVV